MEIMEIISTKISIKYPTIKKTSTFFSFFISDTCFLINSKTGIVYRVNGSFDNLQELTANDVIRLLCDKVVKCDGDTFCSYTVTVQDNTGYNDVLEYGGCYESKLNIFKMAKKYKNNGVVINTLIGTYIIGDI